MLKDCLKNNKKTFIANLIIGLILAVFVVVPFHVSGLHIKLYFPEDTYGICQIFYQTPEDTSFDADKMISAEIENGVCDLYLDGSFKNRIYTLRIDLPTLTDTYEVSKVRITSAGFTVKKYSGYDFFTGDNILFSNDIEAVDENNGSAIIYTGTDPFFVVNSPVLNTVNSGFSRMYLSKAFLALFLILASFFSGKRLF